jgi:hypothetical protein
MHGITHVKTKNYCLPVTFFCGCETWSLTVKEERRLRVFENRVLRRMFGPQRDEVTGEWRRLHSEELCALQSTPNIIWVTKLRMGWAKHVARRARVYVNTRTRHGRPRRRWDNNIKMDLQEEGWAH